MGVQHQEEHNHQILMVGGLIKMITKTTQKIYTCQINLLIHKIEEMLLTNKQVFLQGETIL